jgi:acylaminoacyl-peptidase
MICDSTFTFIFSSEQGLTYLDHICFLILQAPDKFVAAAVWNPVCNLALMVGTTDIPDWCYVEACGSKGKDSFTEAPSAEQLTLFHSKSPISHLSKVCLMEA